jgi:hypothetical protein
MKIIHAGMALSFFALAVVSVTSTASATSQVSGFSGQATNPTLASCFSEGSFASNWSPGAVTNNATSSACNGTNGPVTTGPFNAPFWEVAFPGITGTFQPSFFIHTNNNTAGSVCFAAVTQYGAMVSFSGNLAMAPYSPGTKTFIVSVPTAMSTGWDAMGGCYLFHGETLEGVFY